MDVRTRSEAEFDTLAAGGLGEERYALFARWRTEQPFFSRTADAWILTRFDDVRAVLVAGEDFRPLDTGPGAPVYGRTFLQMSGVEHSRKVGIVGRRIRSARALAAGLGDVVREVSRQHAAALPLGEVVDLKERYTTLVPLGVLTELFQLEHTPAAGVSRRARVDAEVGGVPIRSGDRVLMLMGAANRDPEHFADPEDFVLERFVERPERQFTSAAHTLPFGAGEHFCVGVRLAAAELVESLRALLGRAGTITSPGPVPPLTGFLHYAPASLPAVLHP
jgi:cytochrome P450